MRTLFAECSPGISATDSAAVYARRFAYGDSGVINVAVPGATIDTNWANVQLLFGFEQRDATTTFVNDADSVLLATANGNAQADTAQFKFGASSLLLDGTALGAYLIRRLVQLATGAGADPDRSTFPSELDGNGAAPSSSRSGDDGGLPRETAHHMNPFSK